MLLVARSWCWTECARKWLYPALAVFLLTLGPLNVRAGEYRSWTGDFLRMGAGARALGMGNAYNAVDGDIFSAYYNPAGLAGLNGVQIAVSPRYMSMDRYFSHAAFGSRIGPDADFAISWIGAGTNDVQGRDLNGNRTGTLKDSRNSFAVTFAKNAGNMVSVGVNAKVSLWNLAGDNARAFGFDAGVIVRPVEHLTAALVVRDLNSRFTWNAKRWSGQLSGSDGQAMDKEDKLPLYCTFGLAYRALGDRLILSAMTESVQDNPTGFDMGLSYAVNRIFTLRGGMYNYTLSDQLEYGSLTAGFGLQVTGSIGLDYAYAADALENDRVHVLSLVLNYGE